MGFLPLAFLFLHAAVTVHSGFLTTAGDKVVNDIGEEVHLRGVNMDLHYGRVADDPEAPFAYASLEDIEFLAELGCNSLRMCLHWEMFTTDRGFDLIDTYLSWCEPNGIYLILDMHRPPPDNVTGGREIWNSAIARDSLCSIWASIASRYTGVSGIAGYDLLNEPSASDPDDWWNLAQRIADTIRVHDRNHILFVEAPGGRLNGLELMDDPNTVYSIHCYDPFTVSHAGATWSGDSRVPSNSTYPGDILTGVTWAGWSSEARCLDHCTNGWLYWESGSISIPRGVELVSIKAHSSGNTGTVQFDDFRVFINGEEFPVLNGDIEELSRRRSGIPLNWVFYPDGDFTGKFREEGYCSGGCLETSGSRGSSSWLQTRAFYTEPLFRVEPGDEVEVSAMIRALDNRGEITVGLDFLAEKREYWNRDSLRAVLETPLLWARTNNVPLHVGEFGSMAGTGIESRNNLIADWISVMNQEDLHWSFWTYRTFGAPSFGLFHHDSLLDVPLAEILSEGCRGE